MKLKKVLFTIIAVSMLMFTACGDSSSKADSSKADSSKAESSSESSKAESSAADSSKADSKTDSGSAGKDTIVVYFSATGTTKGVAEKIAEAADADIYEIVPQEKYSDADLDWHDEKSRTTIEMNDPDVRPKIEGDLPDLSGYKRVYIGYPMWWGDAPRIMSTFVESVKLDGKTVIPFCTSGGSGIGSSGKNLEKLSDGGEWLGGERLDGGISEDKLKEWIDGLE